MATYKDGYWQISKASVNYVNHRSIIPSLSSYHPEGLGQNYPVKFTYNAKDNTYSVSLGGLWNGTAQAIMKHSVFQVIDPSGIFVSNCIPLNASLGTDVAGFKDVRVSIVAYEYKDGDDTVKEYTSTLAWLRDGPSINDGDDNELIMTSYRWKHVET